MQNTLKPFNLALAFFLELAMLAAFAYWGYQTGQSPLVRILLAIGIPVLVGVLWGLFMAPTSPRRLQGAAYLVVKLVLFGLAAAALYAAGSRTPAIILAALVVVNTILLQVWPE